jgi:hypothetical protein
MNTPNITLLEILSCESQEGCYGNTTGILGQLKMLLGIAETSKFIFESGQIHQILAAIGSSKNQSTL